jgi:hypothetical protein
MKQLFTLTVLAVSALAAISFGPAADWELEKMPVDLETDFARSALPEHLQAEASVYLLDPKKGYYLARAGTNGFLCFVLRTDWTHPEFRKDFATPISYDAEGARMIFPVYADVAVMRASGKATPQQVKDTIEARFRRGFYKAPKPGISYMLAPLMRAYDESDKMVTMSVPHFMFYAPYLTAADIGCSTKTGPTGPVVLGEGSPHSYALMFSGEKEKSKIVEDNKPLLKRLMEYRSYFKIGQ